MKNAISALHVHKSPKFPHLIGNRGRGTRWWRQIFDRKSWTCELGYGADTMFLGTYFLFLRNLFAEKYQNRLMFLTRRTLLKSLNHLKVWRFLRHSETQLLSALKYIVSYRVYRPPNNHSILFNITAVIQWYIKCTRTCLYLHMHLRLLFVIYCMCYVLCDV